MVVHAVQFDIAWEDKTANFERVSELLRSQSVRAGSLIVLPEMFATGFSMNPEVTRQGLAPECEHFLATLAKQHQSTVLGGVIGGAPSEVPRNEAVAYDRTGEILTRYAKVQPFTPSQEDSTYRRGETIVTFPWGPFRVAPLVCYDLRFPELFRTAVDRGANLFIVIANWPATRADHWRILLQARAIENQAYVIGVNRCGADPQAAYAGGTLAFDPQGRILAQLDDQPGVLALDLDPAPLAAWRRDFPALVDRRWRNRD